ncbi:MAG: hypothetical protein HXY50_05005 [Ignavibacteriaceae bacterium]|nr:hypothetical protein [Ignavibacteriaceae bacterium]
MLSLFFKKLMSIVKIQNFIFSLMLISFLLQTGCEQRKTEEASIPKDTVQVKVEEPAPVDTVSKDSLKVVEVPEVVIPELIGKWTGTFDKRSTTLRITEQDGKSFKGAITINYREVINQQVSGTINEETLEVSMKDLLHSRYAGTYKAKLSQDLKKLSGTFTQNVDKTKFSFSLTKK